MQEDFLTQLVLFIQQKKLKTNQLFLILPSKRSSTFFIEALKKHQQSASVLPVLLTINELNDTLLPIKKKDNMRAVFELYQLYAQLAHQHQYNCESFDDFLFWGNNLLKDFANLDRYLVNTKDFFTYVNDAKALELWHVDGSPLSDGEKTFIEFWKILGNLYHEFEALCIQENSYTNSLQLKYTALNSEKLIAQHIPQNSTFIFAGLNALSAAEEKIIQQLKKTFPVYLFWDMDTYYVENPNQEAGLFIRKYLKLWGTQKADFTPPNTFKTIPKNITLYECNTKYAQVKALAEALSALKTTPQNPQKALKTAIVLNDEDLLLPLLYALPDGIGTANVTMGYSLSQSPLASLILSLVDLWKKSKGNNKDQQVYYYKDLFKLIDHPYAQELFNQSEELKQLKQKITDGNKVYISKKLLSNYLNSSNLNLCFPDNNLLQGSAIITQLLAILAHLKNQIEIFDAQEIAKSIKTEYLYHYTIALRKLVHVLKSFTTPFTIATAKILIHQLVNKEKISFFGEPLSGIQIMGMLETRALDFDEVYLLSTNEGLLPQGRKNQSFFPFDISKQYNLPTHLEQDAIFAYYFYRLIQKAQKVNLFYFTGRDDFGGVGEASRFIKQIEKELLLHNPSHQFTKKIYAPSPEKSKENEVLIKDEALIKAIKTFLQKGVSPSALATYLNCPQDFYYKYILGLYETDDLEENIGSATFGTAIHDTLEALYAQRLNKELRIADIDDFEKQFPQILVQKFTENLSEESVKTGYNRLQFEVAKNYLHRFFKQEKLFLSQLTNPYYIEGLEWTCSHSFCMEIDGENITINLKGKLDRIGRVGEEIHLVDYKSGTVKANDLSIKDVESIYTQNKSKALQLQVYAYLLAQEKKYPSISPNILSLKNQSEGYIPLLINKNKQTTVEIKNNTETLLALIVSDLLNTSMTISHNPKSLYCAYC